MIQFEAARIHLLSEDFLAVAVLVALASYVVRARKPAPVTLTGKRDNRG